MTSTATARHAPPAHRAPSSRRFARAWLAAFGVLFVVMELWSLATPLNGAPDERNQMIKAAAVVRGEWLGSRPPGLGAEYTAVRVPAVYVTPGTKGCFILHPDVPAGCPRQAGSSRVIAAVTYVGHYPPLYYLLVGLPTYLATPSSWYIVRALSIALNAAMLALAFAVAHRWGRSALLVPGLLVATTPMVVFVSAVINPNGLEITSAIAMWTAASVLVVDHPRSPPRGLVAALGGAATVLVLVRGLSPLWPLTCLAALLPLAWGRLDVRGLARRRDVRIATGATITAAVLAAAWIVGAKGLTVAPNPSPAPGTPETTLVRESVGQLGPLFHQALGLFGWFDTPLAPLSQLVLLGVGGSVIVLGLAMTNGRAVLSLSLAIALTVVIPVVLALVTVRHEGFVAQGRYYLPLAAGVPIVAGACLRLAGVPPRLRRRLAAVAIALLATAQLVAAVWALHRYLVGAHGPLSPWAVVPGVWHPPLPGWLLDALMLVGWVALAVVMTRLAEIPERTAPRSAVEVGAPVPA